MTLTDLKSYYERKTEQGTVALATFLTDANSAREEIEAESQWAFLEGTPQSITLPAVSYTTATALTASFAEIKNVVDSNGNEYREIPFSQREMYKDLPYYYYIDYDNNNVYFTGSGTGTVYIYYTPTGTSFTALTDSPAWPAKYHMLLAYKMIVNYFMGEDLDDLNKAKALQSWERRFEKMMRNMFDWDARTKCRQTGTGVRTTDDYLISQGILPYD